MEYTFQIFLKFFQKLYSKMPFWIPISKGRIDFMKQKERFDEKPKQEHTEPVHHRKAIIKGITVYESFRPEGSKLWDCLLQSMGKH